MMCTFCGALGSAPIDVAGRGVCSARCAEKLAARDAVMPGDMVIKVSEVDGMWLVDQVSGRLRRYSR